MIEYRKGNLLDVQEGIIVYGCNAQGVMGSGVALAIKNKYPECYRAYSSPYENLFLGETLWYKVNENLWIANGITQENYGKDNKRYVNYRAICRVFFEVFKHAYMSKMLVNFPKIGAGLGGGDWGIIEQLINDCDPEDKVKKICWEL